jgi:hypothetical protein
VVWSETEHVFIIFGIAAKTTELEGNPTFNAYKSMVTLKIDENLNFHELNIREIKSDFGYYSLRVYDNHSEYLVVLTSGTYGAAGFSQSIQFETAFVRVHLSGEIMSYDYIKDERASCQCIVPMINNKGFYCPGVTGYNLDSNFIFKNYESDRIESVFHFVSTSTYPKWISNFMREEFKMCFPWTNGNYLLSNTYVGRTVGLQHHQGSTLIFLLSHVNSDTIKSISFGSGELSFIVNNMDVSRDSMIYAGNNGYIYSEIAKFDKNLNKIWQIQYSVKDNYIFGFGIKATLDGGFCIYGATYNTYYIPFIARFDKNGGIVSSTAGLEFSTAVKVSPNPFSQYIQLELQTSGANAEFRLFDMNGRNVFVQHDLIDGLNTIDLSDLHSGTYIYKIYQKGREIAGDKLIKVAY